MRAAVVDPSRGVGLHVDYLPAYGYAEVLAGLSPVLAARPAGGGLRAPHTLEARLPDLDWAVSAGSGPFGARPPSAEAADRLEALPRRMAARLRLALDGVEVARLPVALLPAREWPHHPEARRLVAAHASPGDDVVFRIVVDAGPPALPEVVRCGAPGAAHTVLRALYEHLASAHEIAYEVPRVSVDTECGTSHQTVRAAQEVAGEPPLRRGRGNCLDIALLFAGCLEAVGLGPLVFFEGGKDEPPTHAWAGVWADAGERHRPLLSDAADLARRVADGEIIALECTGACAGEHGLGFEEALAAGGARVRRARLVHAVDVAASRPPRGTVRPLSPANDAAVQAAYWAGEALRARQGSRTRETLHVLYGLCTVGGGLTRRVLEDAGSSAELIAGIIERSVPREGHAGPAEETASHRVTRETARANARARGAGTIEEGDVLWAVLDSPSRNVRKVLEAAGCDASALAARLSREWNRPRERTISRWFEAPAGGGA